MCVRGCLQYSRYSELAWQVKRITAGYISGGTGRLEGGREGAAEVRGRQGEVK